MKCLWCNKEQEHPFCIGGGVTREISLTDSGVKFTKSYCMDSFLHLFKGLRKIDFPLDEKDLYFLNNIVLIKEWYKSLPFVEYINQPQIKPTEIKP